MLGRKRLDIIGENVIICTFRIDLNQISRTIINQMLVILMKKHKNRKKVL